MRAPLQILAIPYRMVDGIPHYCVLRRSDSEYWQFIAGGGEDNETPIEAAYREIFEEGGVKAENIIQLTSMCYVQVDIFRNRHLYGWPKDMYVVPEYAFGFECNDEILSRMSIPNALGLHTMKLAQCANGTQTEPRFLN